MNTSTHQNYIQRCSFLHVSPSNDYFFEKSNITSVNQTPRDIKQLANDYIYGVAGVYDKLKNNNSDENGKLKLSPTDFQKDFKEKINLKLPEIVEETVAKQRFNLN